MLKKAMRFGLLGGALSILGALPAAAQQAASTGSPDTKSGTATSSSVTEVVVTAQKRSERLVNVPVVVTAVSGTALANAGVHSIGDLAQVVPGLHIDLNGPYVEPSIRGVSSALGGPGVTPNIAIYVDGVFQPNQGSNNFNFIDVDSIQVLKGPQGTLFGRNATGGAILVKTRDPSFSPEFESRAEYGSFNTARGSLFATGAVTDKLAGSIAIGIDHSDGYLKNDFTEKTFDPSDSYTVRAKALYEPTNRYKFTLTLSGSYQTDPTGFGFSPWRGYVTAPIFYPGTPIESRPYHVDINGQPGQVDFHQGVELKSEVDLGFAALTSYSSADWLRERSRIDVDITRAPLEIADWVKTEQTYSQEFDLGRSGQGPLDWVVGFYFYHDIDIFKTFNVSLFGSPSAKLFDSGQTTETYAVFGDATYNIGNWHLTAGARLNYDDAAVFFQGFPSYLGTVLTPKLKGQTGWTNFTPRVVVRYSLTPQSNLYVSWSTGTKSGFYNATSFNTAPDPVSPEKITDFEGGYKVSEPNWQLELSAFHYNYKGLQVAVSGLAGNFVQNAASSEIYGGEAHWRQQLIENLWLDVAAAYTRGYYTKFPNAFIYTWNPATGVGSGSADVSGGALERAPTWSGAATLSYRHPLFGGSLELNANYSYQTKEYFDFNHFSYEGPYGLLNLRVGWTDPSQRWSVALNANNATNQKYLAQILEDQFFFGQEYGPPANVMVSVGYRY